MAAATSARIAVRTARDGDAVALADLSTQLGYPLDAVEMSTRLARVRAAGAGEVFVAEDVRGQLVGWTHVVPRLQLEDGALPNSLASSSTRARAAAVSVRPCSPPPKTGRVRRVSPACACAAT